MTVKGRIALCLAAASPFMVFPALAEDEIIVTATKTARPLADIPASVSVIGAGRLANGGAYDRAEDVTRLATGVQAAVANGSQVAFQIRGIGAVDHQALTPGAAAIYADGVFLATNVQTGFLLYDLERVEVLKGPQGSLYGRNASSGAINFISVRPAAEQESYLSVSAGNHQRLDVSGAFGASLTEGLHLRLAGRRLTQGPLLDNVVSDPARPVAPADGGGERDDIGLRGALLWQSAEAGEVLVRAHYEEANGINPAPRNDALDIGDHEISIGGDGIQDTDNEFYGAAVEVTRPLGDWSLFSLTAVEGYNQQYGFDFDGSPAPFGAGIYNANLSYDRDFLQLSEELRLSRDHALGSSLVGLALSSDDFSQDYLIWCGDLGAGKRVGSCPYVGTPGRVGPAPASDATPMSLLTRINQQRRSVALFTWNDVDVTDRLTATLGLRYTAETLEGNGYGLHYFADGVVAYNDRDGLGAARGSNEIDESRLSGTIAARYALADNHSAYVSFANGYKSGGFNGEVQNNATHWQEEGLFSAETVNALEAGYRGRIGEALSVSAALFHQAYDAPQARIFVAFPQPDGSTITSNSLSNLDEAVARGIEAEAVWTPGGGLELLAGVTLLDTEISQSDDGAIGNAGLFDGNPLPFASPVSANLGARWAGDLGTGRRLTLQGNAAYRDDYYLDAEGLEARREDGYLLVDGEAALSFEGAGTTLALWGRNLLDEDYAVSGYGFIGYNTFRSAPRQYGVSVTRAF